MKEAPKPERPLYLDMDFGEALARYAQTKPEEVEPPPGKKRKVARPPKKTGDLSG
jgi:hypothetical protein